MDTLATPTDSDFSRQPTSSSRQDIHDSHHATPGHMPPAIGQHRHPSHTHRSIQDSSLMNLQTPARQPAVATRTRDTPPTPADSGSASILRHSEEEASLLQPHQNSLHSNQHDREQHVQRPNPHLRLRAHHPLPPEHLPRELHLHHPKVADRLPPLLPQLPAPVLHLPSTLRSMSQSVRREGVGREDRDIATLGRGR